MTLPIHRTIPVLLVAALLAPLAACDEAGETGAVEGDGDAVVVTPVPESGAATDG